MAKKSPEDLLDEKLRKDEMRKRHIRDLVKHRYRPYTHGVSGVKSWAKPRTGPRQFPMGGGGMQETAAELRGGGHPWEVRAARQARKEAAKKRAREQYGVVPTEAEAEATRQRRRAEGFEDWEQRVDVGEEKQIAGEGRREAAGVRGEERGIERQEEAAERGLSFMEAMGEIEAQPIEDMGDEALKGEALRLREDWQKLHKLYKLEGRIRKRFGSAGEAMTARAREIVAAAEKKREARIGAAEQEVEQERTRQAERQKIEDKRAFYKERLPSVKRDINYNIRELMALQKESLKLTTELEGARETVTMLQETPVKRTTTDGKPKEASVLAEEQKQQKESIKAANDKVTQLEGQLNLVTNAVTQTTGKITEGTEELKRLEGEQGGLYGIEAPPEPTAAPTEPSPTAAPTPTEPAVLTEEEEDEKALVEAGL